MGVFGLATVLSRDDRFFERVSISERGNEELEKSIAIDGNGLLYKILDKVEWRAGCAASEIFVQTRNFLSQILYHNLRCIIIFDGKTEDRKKETANERLLERSNNAHAFVTNPRARGKSVRPMFLHSIFTYAATQLRDRNPGAIEIIQCSTEADPFIAHYAQTHDNCIGVLAKDSDFCIFRNTVYFPYNTLSLSPQDIKVCRYDSTKLAETLELTPELLVLLAIQLGTDHVKRKVKIGSKELFDLLVEELKGVTNVEEYVLATWNNSNMFQEAQNFYLDLESHPSLPPSCFLTERGDDISVDPSDNDKRVFELIDQRTEKGLELGPFSFLFTGETILPVLAISPQQNYLIWTHLRYIRQVMYQLFYPQLGCYEYCIKERIPNQKSIKVIPIRLKECPTLSMKKIRSMIQKFVPLVALPETLEMKKDSPHFTYLDAFALHPKQKEALLAYLCIPKDDRDVLVPLWCSFTGDIGTKWFCLILLVLHHAEALAESEMVTICDYFLQSLSGASGIPVDSHLQSAHIKRARHLHFTLEASIYHIEWVQNILEFPSSFLQYLVKWLKPTLFFDLYKQSLRTRDGKNRKELEEFVSIVKENIKFEGKQPKKKKAKRNTTIQPKPAKFSGGFHNSFAALTIET